MAKLAETNPEQANMMVRLVGDDKEQMMSAHQNLPEATRANVKAVLETVSRDEIADSRLNVPIEELPRPQAVETRDRREPEPFRAAAKPIYEEVPKIVTEKPKPAEIPPQPAAIVYEAWRAKAAEETRLQPTMFERAVQPAETKKSYTIVPDRKVEAPAKLPAPGARETEISVSKLPLAAETPVAAPRQILEMPAVEAETPSMVPEAKTGIVVERVSETPAYGLEIVESEAPAIDETVEPLLSETAGSIADWQPKELFEDETMLVYLQLTALAAAAETQPVEAGDEAGGIEPADAVVADFETFIAAQPATEQPATFEALQERAAEQPLEQTLVQLAAMASETIQLAEAQPELLKVLQSIEAAIPARPEGLDGTETIPQITPEMAESLVALLKVVGYQQPGETLIAFVAKYDLAFLLQAVEYLYRLLDETNRQEFLLIANATASNDDSARLRLGRVLFGLISPLLLDHSL